MPYEIKKYHLEIKKCTNIVFRQKGLPIMEIEKIKGRTSRLTK